MKDDEISTELIRSAFEKAVNSGRSETVDSRVLTWILGIVSVLGCAGIVGDVVMYATVKAQGQELYDLKETVVGLKFEIDTLLARQFQHADKP